MTAAHQEWQPVDRAHILTPADKRLMRTATGAVNQLVDAWSHLPARLHEMRAQLAGQPGAARYDGDIVSGHTTIVDEHGIPMPSHSDPTGEAGIRPDRAADDRLELGRQVRALNTAILRINDICTRYDTRQATIRERTTSDGQDKGCASCSRAINAQGVQRWEPVFVAATTVKGNLAEPADLCSWCYKFTRDTGRLPNLSELGAHHDGRHVPWPSDHRHFR